MTDSKRSNNAKRKRKRYMVGRHTVLKRDKSCVKCRRLIPAGTIAKLTIWRYQFAHIGRNHCDSAEHRMFWYPG